MRLSRGLALVACGWMVGCVVSAAEPELFKCVDADGTVSLQDDPCPVAPPKKATPKAPAASAKPRAKTVAAASAKATPAPKPAARPVARMPARAPLKNVPWEPTWNAFITALKNGDRPGAIRCLTSDALTGLGPTIESAPAEQLTEILHGFQKVVVEGELGPYWSIRVLRGSMRPKWIFFERTPRGEWKIAAI